MKIILIFFYLLVKCLQVDLVVRIYVGPSSIEVKKLYTHLRSDNEKSIKSAAVKCMLCLITQCSFTTCWSVVCSFSLGDYNEIKLYVVLKLITSCSEVQNIFEFQDIVLQERCVMRFTCTYLNCFYIEIV